MNPAGQRRHLPTRALRFPSERKGPELRHLKDAALALRVCLIGLCSAACVSPYGGAPLIPAHTVFIPIAGYVVTAADIVSEKEGAMIHGTICRRDVTSFPISQLMIEHVRPGRSDIAREEAYVYGMWSWRWPACGYYTTQTKWRVSLDDTIRIGMVNVR